MIPPWLLPSKNRRVVSSTLWPFFWKAAWAPRPDGWIIARPRNSMLRKPCCMRSATVLKPEKSESTETMCPMSSLANPAHGVAQNTKLCSFDIDCTLPASISLASPSSPWPYRDGRAGTGEAGSRAERGMLHTNGALMTPI